VLGAVFGSVFSIIVHKLNLTSGVIPSMGMAMALINFFTVQTWNSMLQKLDIKTLPFTPQVLDLSLFLVSQSLPFPST
jgi:hypothetical protein